MSVEVHVEGQVRYGGLPDFTIALEHYRDYAVAHGYTVPEALLGLSGKMNTVRLVYRYDDPSEYAEQESRTTARPRVRQGRRRARFHGRFRQLHDLPARQLTTPRVLPPCPDGGVAHASRALRLHHLRQT
jgi:hypothetical protein